MYGLLFALQLAEPDTIRIRTITRPPRPEVRIESLQLGSPQVRIRTGQGTALVWLLRAQDTVFVAATIPDSTPYWGDDFVVSLDPGGMVHPLHSMMTSSSTSAACWIAVWCSGDEMAGGSRPAVTPIGVLVENDRVVAGR